MSDSTNKSQNKHALAGYAFALGSTAIWSGNFIIARGLSDSIPPVTLAFWRWVVATIVFLPFALKPLIAEREMLKKHLPYLSITALLGITIFNTLIYIAGHTTTAVNLALISITFPIFIVILSRLFFGEAITLNKGIGIVLVLAGVLMLISKGALSSLLDISFAIGDLWMLIASVVFAVYSILLKRRPPELGLLAFQLSTFILGLLFLFPFFLWEQTAVSPVEFETRTLLSILYVGVFASLVAFLLWNKAITAVGPSKAAMVYYMLPLFSGALAYLFLGESIRMVHFYSALLIVSGILAANYEPKKGK